MIWRRLAFAWLVFLTALNVYRAATWSMTIDEARVFNDFVVTPFRALFESYDACYHVLHTWVTRLTVAYLGRGEWVVRLPGVIAAIWYFAAVWKLAQRVLGTGPLHLLAVVVLSANPLILDHLSLARGYGLALTLFTWAFYYLVVAASDSETAPGESGRITKAGYLLGLSVAANLTFLFPVAGLTVIFVAVWTRRQGFRPGELIDRLLLPMIVPATLILMIPLTRMTPGAFYFGTGDLHSSWQSLYQHSLKRPGTYRPEWVGFMEVWVMPVAAVLVAAAAIWVWKKLEGAAAHALVFAVGTIALALAALAAAHRWAGLPYPETRTGLYLIWLVLLAWLAALRAPLWSGAMRTVPWILGVILVAIGVQFIALTSSGTYQEFNTDAEVKQAVGQLRQLQGTSLKTANVGGSWEYMEGVNYYRLRYRLRWMLKPNRDALKPGFDYYVLTSQDADWIEKLRLQRLWTGPRTGIILAVP